MHTGLETDDVMHIMHVHYGQQSVLPVVLLGASCIASSDKGRIICILVKSSFVQLYQLKGK